MKKILSILFLLVSFAARSQSVVPLRADTIKIYKVGGPAELVLQNATKDTTGFLYNTGNGVTKFLRGLRKINDSTYLIGPDTLKIHAAATGPVYTAAGYSITVSGDTLKLVNDLASPGNLKYYGTNSIGIRSWLSFNYDSLTNKPTIPAQFNPAVGLFLAQSGSYPNITTLVDTSAASGYYLRRKDSTEGGYYPYSSNPLGYLLSSSLNTVWKTTGNSGTSFLSNFIGTTDTARILFKQNNVKAGIIDSVRSTTGFGYKSLLLNTLGIRNVAIGYESMAASVFGSTNTAVGYRSLAVFTGSDNTALGVRTLEAAVSGNHNTAVGEDVLRNLVSGTYNTGIGEDALFSTTGDFNTGLGADALLSNTVGYSNTAAGWKSLYGNISGNRNSGFGDSILLNITTGSSNTAIGWNTGIGITTGSFNTIIGANVTGLSSSLNNNIIISDGSGTIKLRIDSSNNLNISQQSSVSDTAAYKILAQNSSGDIRKLSFYPLSSTPNFHQVTTVGNATTNSILLGVSSLQPSMLNLKLVVADSVNDNGINIVNASSTAGNRSILVGQRSRGTLSSPTAVQQDDWLLGIVSGGYDGTNRQTPAAIEFKVDTTVSSGSVPSRIEFLTGNYGGDRATRLTIRYNGNIGIGTTKPDRMLDVNGISIIRDTLTITTMGTSDSSTRAASTQYVKQLIYSVTGGSVGEVNTASNLGITTYGLYKTKVGADLQFKSITSSGAIILTSNTNDVAITLDTISGKWRSENYYNTKFAAAVGNLSPLFTSSLSAGTVSYSLSNASGFTLFGRSSGSGAPSYLASIDSNWVPALHSEAYYNTKYLAGIDTNNISNFSVKVRSLHTVLAPLIYNSATGQFSLDTASGKWRSENYYNTKFAAAVGNLSPLFTSSLSAGTVSYSLSNASGFTLFGRGTGSGSPSYLASIDSNWVPALHTEAYYNTKYAAIGGGGGVTPSNTGIGYRLVIPFTGQVKTLESLYGIYFDSTGTTIKIGVDTSDGVTNVATQGYVDRAIAAGGGGSGEVNTASSVGGGLSLYAFKGGVDLKFRSMNTSDFDSASNLISIDYVNGQKASSSVNGFLKSIDYKRSFTAQTISNPTGTWTFDIDAGGQADVSLTATGGRTLAFSNIRAGDLALFRFNNTSGASITLTLPGSSFLDGTSAATTTIPTGRSQLSLSGYDATNYFFSSSSGTYATASNNLSFFSSTTTKQLNDLIATDTIGTIPPVQYAVVASDFTLSAASGVQTAFPSTQDVWTLAASTTYEVEGHYFITTGTTTTKTTALAFALAGGATVTTISLHVLGSNNTANTTQTAQGSLPMTQVSSTVVTATATTAGVNIFFKGIIITNASGTWTPQIAFSANPGGTNLMKAGSYIKFTKLGTSAQAQIGNVN